MIVTLVKHLIDASTDDVLGLVYRKVQCPIVPYPHTIYQDRHLKVCELIQSVGFDATSGEWEAVTLPALLAVDQTKESLIKDAENAGWLLDKDHRCVVDFIAKWDEEDAIGGALSGPDTGPDTDSPSEEGGSDAVEPDWRSMDIDEDWWKKHGE
jgi:hypothetical protein